MLKPILYTASLSIFLLSACNSAGDKTHDSGKIEASDTLNYSLKTYRLESELEKKPGDTIKEKTYFAASYPVFNDSVLNRYVQSLVVMNNNPDEHFNSLEEAGESFIKSYEDYQRKDYSSPWPWYTSIDARVVKNNPFYISIAVNYGDFMGGAHGNHGIIYGNYDLGTQKELTLADIIEAGKMDSLTFIAEEIFIDQEGIANEENSLEDYFFKDDKFSLNDNFLLKDSSIEFLYNIYEIKAYASGITQLEIPYSKIENLLSPRAKEILRINRN